MTNQDAQADNSRQTFWATLAAVVLLVGAATYELFLKPPIDHDAIRRQDAARIGELIRQCKELGGDTLYNHNMYFSGCSVPAAKN